MNEYEQFAQRLMDMAGDPVAIRNLAGLIKANGAELPAFLQRPGAQKQTAPAKELTFSKF